jgi:uncharacterized membrane protein
MRKIQRTIDIKAPAQRVYDFLNTPANLPSIWPNLVSVSNVVDSAGGAHDFDWVFKMAGIPFQGHTKAEEAQAGRLARFRNEGGIPSTLVWTYTGLDGSGMRLTVEVEYTIPTPVIGKLAEALVARMNENDFDALLANLKDVMEHPSVADTAAPRAH